MVLILSEPWILHMAFPVRQWRRIQNLRAKLYSGPHETYPNKPLNRTVPSKSQRHEDCHRSPAFSLRLGSRLDGLRQVVLHGPRRDLRRPPAVPLAEAGVHGCTMLPTCHYAPYWRNLRRVATVQLLFTHHVGCLTADIAREVRAMAPPDARGCHRPRRCPAGGAQAEPMPGVPKRLDRDRRADTTSTTAMMAP